MKKIVSQLKPKRIGAGVIVEGKYQRLVEVLLYEPGQHPDEFTEYYNLDEADMVEIDKWVQEHDLGFRKSYNSWKLKTDDAVTMFLLKWNN